MKTILAPTDFSASSINAVHYAADLALAIDAKLVLFHAIPFPIAVSEISVPEDFIDEMLQAGRRDLETLAESLRLKTLARIAIVTDVRLGSVELELESITNKERPLAIVMGIKSGKSLERALMGSSVFHSMNHIHYPTLVIPATAVFKPIREIGIACDLHKVTELLPLESIKEWLYLLRARVHVLNISSEHKAFKADKLTESIDLLNQLNTFHPEFHFITGDHIAEELNTFIHIHHLDLLMVVPKKHGIFRVFDRKISKEIVSHNPIPVLSIHENRK